MNDNKGVTLVELVISIGIMSLIFLVASNFLMFGLKTHNSSSDEANIQANMRLLSTNINNSIRNSSSTFTFYKTDHKDFSKKWNYIMVSPDGKSVFKYEWDESKNKHIKTTIMNEIDDTTFRLEFLKKTSYVDKDNIIGFNIIANVAGSERVIESGLEGMNSLQITDKRSAKGRSNTIAYRVDPRPSAVTESQAAVAMVLDTSNSMNWDMNGHNTSSSKDRRISKLKSEANRLLEGLGKNPNVYVSLNPFNATANNSQEMLHAQTNIGPGGSLTNDINNLKLSGGTNTGDGMRRAYHRIKQFNEKDSTIKHTKNFMIILVDGRTSRVSIHTTKKDADGNRGFVTGDIDIDFDKNGIISSGDTKYYDYGAVYSSSGSSADRYVNTIGSMIKNYKSDKFNEDIKVYVIGFSNVAAEKDRLGIVAQSASGSDHFYEAGDETALREIFEMIKKDIDDSLWQIGGPQ